MTEEECARGAARAAVQAAVAAVQGRLVLHPTGEEVCIYPGFTEHAYRLVFPFEDHFAPDAPQLLTVTPSGVVETKKMLKPKKGAGLIAYTYPQSISDELAEAPVTHQVDGSSMNGSGCALRDTAFVWRRKDGTNALIQTCPTALND